MEKFFKIYDSIIEKAIIILLAFMVISLFAQVVARHFLNLPIMWTDEIGRYVFIWIVYLGSAVVFKDGNHLIVDVLTDKMPRKLQSFLKDFFNILIMAFLLLVFILGSKFSMINMGNPAYSTNIISIGMAYASIPVGALLMIINILRSIYENRRIEKEREV